MSDLMNDVRIKYFWIFVTERCNLSCQYCFFKNRTMRGGISPKSLDVLLQRFPQLAESEFVISGGEPLLEWGLTKRIIRKLRPQTQRRILLQTNGVLLKTDILSFLSDFNCSLEIGLDGGKTFSGIQRNGIVRYYNRIVKNIALAKKTGIPVTITMTVLPDRISGMFDNFLKILALGPQSIEITPGAFLPWTHDAATCFADEYKRIIIYTLKHKLHSVLSNEYDSKLATPFVDLIVLPDDSILSNWALLSLPRSKKKSMRMLYIDRDTVKINGPFKKRYSPRYRELFKEQVTYRDYSNLNCHWVYHELFPKNAEVYYRNYVMAGKSLEYFNRLTSAVRRYA